MRKSGYNPTRNYMETRPTVDDNICVHTLRPLFVAGVARVV